MDITILYTSKQHLIYPHLFQWTKNSKTHEISLLNKISDVKGGDILFLIAHLT